MYDLLYHKEKDPEVIREFIGKYPFAFLSGCDAKNRPVATQVPLFLEERNGKQFLLGHIIKNTDHHKTFLQNENVLAVFTGHHTYVSATWYSNPNNASTWNYMSVHARGMIHFTDHTALEDILRKTSLYFENGNRQSTTVFDNLPQDFIKKVMPFIVAFEIEVAKIDTVFKLSQDRDSESYLNIIKQLKKQDENGHVIAAEMEKRFAKLFPNESKTQDL